MKIVRTIAEMQLESESLRRAGKTIALVPTMGYLHDGHAQLIRVAKEISDVVITTIFVNPTQFAPGEDFERYPRDFQRDRQVASAAGAHIIFYPEANEMYPEAYATYVEVERLSRILEGRFRPAHFKGVTTVVAKLFHVTKPHFAVFGQKDAQQAFIIQRMVRDLNFDIEIVIAPIVRERDGLAMSSRNAYLKGDDRTKAAFLYKSLNHAMERVRSGERSVRKLREEMEKIIQGGTPTGIDYIAFVQPGSFAEVETIEPPGVLIALAVRFGPSRLIDNILVHINQP